MITDFGTMTYDEHIACSKSSEAEKMVKIEMRRIGVEANDLTLRYANKEVEVISTLQYVIDKVVNEYKLTKQEFLNNANSNLALCGVTYKMNVKKIHVKGKEVGAFNISGNFFIHPDDIEELKRTITLNLLLRGIRLGKNAKMKVKYLKYKNPTVLDCRFDIVFERI